MTESITIQPETGNKNTDA